MEGVHLTKHCHGRTRTSVIAYGPIPAIQHEIVIEYGAIISTHMFFSSNLCKEIYVLFQYILPPSMLHFCAFPKKSAYEHDGVFLYSSGGFYIYRAHVGFPY